MSRRYSKSGVRRNEQQFSMSDYFEWDAATYGLDVPAMDSEHKTLIRLMNTTHALHLAHAPVADLTKALQELAAYTQKHFADEEAYMARIEFPELRIHAGVHKQLLERLARFAADFQRTGTLGDDFFAFLKMWLKAHICGVDAKYACHPRARTA